MTFSIAARDPLTGAFGLAVTTSGLCVGARCPYALAGVGAVLTQHRTDPRLGPLGLQLLERGLTAEQTVAALTEGRDDAKWRQIAVVDAAGRTAAFHGDAIYSWHGHAAADGAIAIGNILRSEAIPQAMLDAFLDDRTAPMETRLVSALTAGLSAGGELDPLGSAALLIVRDDAFAWMDLRVDRSSDPIGDLAALAAAYAPDAEGTRMRAIDPDAVPNNKDLMRRHAELQRSA
ncbi:DUF1028 domain-containing protein [Thalassobaculum sp.]|uniref:DUF1028 domain-containing protein n=1 Tax=Thalassobaculum sp. TaxID=2022740 RepID=UPI0032F01B74